jgi:ribonuclease HI
MSKKFYVVWKGAKTGVFSSWPETKALIDGRSDAQYMGFESLEAAEQAFQASYTKALMNRSLAKNGSSASTTKTTPSATSRSSTTKKPSVAPSAKLIADINIYCDGACSPNPGKSGTGMAVYQQTTLTELWYGLHQANGTNNTAELNGLLEAFKYAKPYIEQNKQVQVLSDSKYSIDCITKWAKGWKTKGWTRGKGEEIKNLAIIQEAYQLYQQLKSNLTINHVKGHANIEGNELSDRMAVIARVQKEKGFTRYTETMDIKTILAMQPG